MDQGPELLPPRSRFKSARAVEVMQHECESVKTAEERSVNVLGMKQVGDGILSLALHHQPRSRAGLDRPGSGNIGTGFAFRAAGAEGAALQIVSAEFRSALLTLDRVVGNFRF